MKHAALVGELRAARDRLAGQVFDEMYANPFWLERFGERGRHHMRQDSVFHLDYLVQALEAGAAEVLENYARWLQQLLTARGMCTRHIAENFDRLARAIAAEPWPDTAAAVELLGAATRALRYPDGPARAVQDAAPMLAAAALDSLYARHPGWPDRGQCADDLDHHLSYAADALALGSPAVFVQYIDWLDDFLDRRGAPAEQLRESLAALAALPAASEPLRGVLRAGAQVLRTTGS